MITPQVKDMKVVFGPCRLSYVHVFSKYDPENDGNGKRFQDCTANNANHPNDFLMRVYAQTIVYSLFGEDYIDHI